METETGWNGGGEMSGKPSYGIPLTFQAVQYAIERKYLEHIEERQRRAAEAKARRAAFKLIKRDE